MPSCDMCGKDAVSAIALIEGVELTVCESCSKFGKIVRTIQPPKPQKRSIYQTIPQKKENEEEMEFVVDDYATRIRQKRESMNLTQQEFAKKLNERESVVHHLENSTSHPSLELARRLEHILKIKLVEVAKEAAVVKSKSSSGAFTLGDFIRIKK